MAQAEFISVSPSGASVTLQGSPLLGSVTVISENIAVPVYFRADGVTASVHSPGCRMTVGVGGCCRIIIPPVPSVTVSLVSTGTGYVEVIGDDAI